MADITLGQDQATQVKILNTVVMTCKQLEESIKQGKAQTMNKEILEQMKAQVPPDMLQAGGKFVMAMGLPKEVGQTIAIMLEDYISAIRGDMDIGKLNEAQLLFDTLTSTQLTDTGVGFSFYPVTIDYAEKLLIALRDYLQRLRAVYPNASKLVHE